MASEYLGGGVATPVVDSTSPHDTVTEAPPPITSLQPPASNAGSDDPTAGISKQAGGLSGSAGIGSPVPNDQSTIVGSVLESVFGKKERTAEEVEAAAPTSDTVSPAQPTSSSSSNAGVLGAIAGAAAAGSAAVASVIPNMSTTAAEAQVAPSTTEKVAGEGATEPVPPAEATTEETKESAKQNEGVSAVERKEEHEQDPQAAEEAKKKADHAAAVRENSSAIPTAGGEKVGASHEGESKIIPEKGAPPKDDGVSAAAGQPDAVTADNTAKNATAGDSKASKPKFSERLKKALHMGDKKDKA